MGIELFDKRYVYLEWSDELEGEDCILAKTYQDLKDFVNSGDEGRFCKVNKGKEKPFTNHWSECDFCYYDHNLKVKKAWLEGETIQKLVLNEWKDDIDTERTSLFFYNIKWDAYEWRVKPTEEIWYVIFAEDTFLRVSMIDNLSNTVFFSGTYEECGKWIDEHKVYVEVLSAYKHGKTIQYKPNRYDFWIDWTLKEYPNINSLEQCDWRIKPTTEVLFVNVHHGETLFDINICKDADESIFCGTRKQCEYVMKKIDKNFVLNNCSYKCKGTNCNNCAKLLAFVKDIEFKTTRRMTNKELAEWLAKGNGEVKVNDTLYITCYYTYIIGSENVEVGDSVFIREWSSDEWKEPLIEVD